MSSNIRQIIAQAEASGDWDEAADWCEDFDWERAEGIPAAEIYLETAAKAAARATEQQAAVTGAQLVEAVMAARDDGTSWERIAEVLGITSRAARQRYDMPTEDPVAR